jgi:arsenate reductase (glutaredoxin)
VDYTIEPLSKGKLRELLGKMREGPRALLRTKEPIYRALGLDSKELTDEQLLDALAEHPSLVQRPIVERGNRAVVARPVERARDLL